MELFSKKKLNEFGKDYVKILIAKLKKAGKSASGALINSIDYRLKEDAKSISIEIEANDYLEWVDKGRKPGSYPPLNEISKWASLKGIPDYAVFPIARKIFKFGIEPTNVIRDTEKEILTSPTLRRKLESEMVDNLEEIIVKGFED